MEQTGACFQFHSCRMESCQEDCAKARGEKGSGIIFYNMSYGPDQVH